MGKALKRTTMILITLSTFMSVICVLSFVGAVSWLNKPFPGFLMYRPPFVGSMSLKEWPGRQAGLKFLERVVKVDGQPVGEGQDVVDWVRHKQKGTPVHYVLETTAGIREVTIPVDIFGFRDFSLTFFFTFLGGLILCILGVIVVLLKPNMASSWVFLSFCFTLGGYMITSFESLSSYYVVPFHYFFLCFMGTTLFHLGLIFPVRKRILARLPTLEYIIYLPAIVLIVLWWTYYFNFTEILNSNALTWMPSYKLIGTVTRILTLFCVASMTVFVFHAMLKAATTSVRQRAKMILFGVAIAFLPSTAIMMGFYIFKVNFPWNFLVFFVIFFPASVAYSIVRHNLFDADEIIKRTVGYFIVTAIVVGAYALVSVIFNVFMANYQVAQSRVFPILFTLGVIFVFNPLRNRIQSLVDRIFFRKEYDYGAIVEKVSGAMTSLPDLPQILKRLTQTFIEDMFIDTSSVMLLTPDGTQYQVHLADGEQTKEVENKAFKRNDPLMEIIEGEKKELTKYDVIEDPRYREVSEPCVADFEALQASLIVPLVYQDKVIGSLNLGEKKSGKAFNGEDIELLRTLAHQGAVAIENARLFQENLEKQRMEEELNIARELQMSMLPADSPEIKGFKIASYSVSAREVGGDFYDFIDMGEDKAGFVIGDVTGKSVSGALVMSASRSIFRMLSEETLSVSESMMRANRRLKKDIKSGMFVALLYAVLDAEEKTVTMCSAGQTQPLLMSAKTGEVKLVETKGDTFPLGILEDVSYEETRLQLDAGDMVAFYTDGIVEAMNQNQEIFGFDRLQEIVKGASSSSADALLKEILHKVNEFTGSAPQHDDLTVIVVSVE